MSFRDDGLMPENTEGVFGIFSYHPGTPLTCTCQSFAMYMSKECLDDAKYAFIVLCIAGLHF